MPCRLALQQLLEHCGAHRNVSCCGKKNFLHYGHFIEFKLSLQFHEVSPLVAAATARFSLTFIFTPIGRNSTSRISSLASSFVKMLYTTPGATTSSRCGWNFDMGIYNPSPLRPIASSRGDNVPREPYTIRLKTRKQQNHDRGRHHEVPSAELQGNFSQSPAIEGAGNGVVQNAG